MVILAKEFWRGRGGRRTIDKSSTADVVRNMTNEVYDGQNFITGWISLQYVGSGAVGGTVLCNQACVWSSQSKAPENT